MQFYFSLNQMMNVNNTAIKILRNSKENVKKNILPKLM